MKVSKNKEAANKIVIDDVILTVPSHLKDRLPLFYSHMQRYRYLKDYVKNKTVLDIGCGEGYGSYYLAHYAKEVIGIDIDKKVIQKAQNLYSRNGLYFYQVNVYELIDKLPQLKSNVDIAVAMELIEHLKKPGEFLEIVKEILKPEGCFFLSTPNRIAREVENIPWNPEHVKEYTEDELKELLSKYFRKVKIIGLTGTAKAKDYERIRQGGKLPSKLKMMWRFMPSSLKTIIRKVITLNLPTDVTLEDYYFVEKIDREVASLLAICVK